MRSDRDPARRVSDRLCRICPLARSSRACGGGGGDGGRKNKTEADAIALAHLGWATEAQMPSRRHRPSQAVQGAAPTTAGAFSTPSGARHLARPAARVESTLAKLLRRD